MTEFETQERINKAVLEAIASLIPVYFAIAKALLFILGIVFAVVIVGLMLAGNVLVSAIHLATACSQRAKEKHQVGVSA